MPTASSRRVPWPWDVRIASVLPSTDCSQIFCFRGTPIGDLRGRLIGNLRGQSRPFGLSQGLMLLPQSDSSLMIARKQTNLDSLYPATAEYDSAPVYRERTFMFRPTGGFGEPIQSAAADRRYHYGINVWVSGGLFGKGPLVHAVAPGGAGLGMCRLFLEAREGATDRLFYLTRSGVYRRDDDTDAGQFLSRTGSGEPLDAARFTGAFGGAVDCFYVAWSDGRLEEHAAGGGWTACVLPVGFSAHFLEVIGESLYAADRDRCIVRHCVGDPKLAASWTGPIIVGTPSVPITAIRSSNNQIAIFKADGRVYTIDKDGNVLDLFPGLDTSLDPDNGRTASAWLNTLWFRAGRAFYQLELSASGGVLVPKGPGRNLGNLSEVRGPVQCFAGWNTQMAFAVIYNSGLNASYLLSYGSWVPKADPSQEVPTTVSGTAYSYVDQFDGALKKWAGRMATSCFVSNIPNEARLYVGFADGGYDWIHLVPYPLLPGQGGEYTLEPSYIVMPLHHSLFQADNKHWTGASIFGPRLPRGTSVHLDYHVMAQSVGTGAAPTADGWLPWGPPLGMNGMRSNPDRPVAGKTLELRISLDNSNIGQSPILEGVGLHERLVPAFRRDYTLTVNANDYIARRDGASTRQSGVTIRKWMEQAASAPASIVLELPDETLSDVALFSYEERMVPHAQRGGIGFAIAVQATQFAVLQIYGTVGRLRGTRIGDLRGFLISDLKFL